MEIFVTGAAGYSEGSIAEKLVASGYEVTGLAKSGKQVPLLKARGIDSVVGTLDDPETLTKAAQSADAVINAASADHTGSVVTLVTALERSGKLLIHTSGSAIVADYAYGECGKTTGLPLADVILQYDEAARLGAGSNSLVSAVNARRLGWAPKAPTLAEWLNTISGA